MSKTSTQLTTTMPQETRDWFREWAYEWFGGNESEALRWLLTRAREGNWAPTQRRKGIFG
jgi:hypothetical protein